MSPHDGLGSSPVRGSGSYFASTSQPTGPRLSRYRTDFEEVEFLVREDLFSDLLTEYRVKAASGKWSKLEID